MQVHVFNDCQTNNLMLFLLLLIVKSVDAPPIMTVIWGGGVFLIYAVCYTYPV